MSSPGAVVCQPRELPRLGAWCLTPGSWGTGRARRDERETSSVVVVEVRAERGAGLIGLARDVGGGDVHALAAVEVDHERTEIRFVADGDDGAGAEPGACGDQDDPRADRREVHGLTFPVPASVPSSAFAA